MKKYKDIEEIVCQCVQDIASDVKSLEYISSIDFMDIFPKSEQHRKILDDEAQHIAVIIDKTERGNFYILNIPIKTEFGMLKIIKIRKFDKTRLNWVAAPDFATTDYEKFVNKYKKDDRFTYIEKSTYKGLEFKTKKSLIYFLDELTTAYYNV